MSEERVYVLKITHDDHFNVVHPALEGLLGPDYFSDYSGETAYKIEAFDSVVKGVDGNPFFVHDVKSSYDEDSGDDVGPPNSLSIGTVTAGAPGSVADADITGESPSQTLSLVLPRGDVGPQGFTRYRNG